MFLNVFDGKNGWLRADDGLWLINVDNVTFYPLMMVDGLLVDFLMFLMVYGWLTSSLFLVDDVDLLVDGGGGGG